MGVAPNAKTLPNLKALKGLDVAAAELGISVECLRRHADNGDAPHWRREGEPLFHLGELAAWYSENIVTRCNGRAVPTEIIVVPRGPRALPVSIPEEIRQIAQLEDLTSLSLRSGVYFLCRKGSVIYVGQSSNPAARIASHRKQITFDQVFFLPIAADDLDRIETALIMHLRPTMNGKRNNGEFHTPNIRIDTKTVIRDLFAAQHLAADQTQASA